MAGGRPTLYQESYPDQARKLCLLNATDEDLADFFDVSVATISNWKNDHPEFLEAIKTSDGIVLSLAEHNGAYATVFKNLFDWMSRIDGKLWSEKPMLLMATSPGARGGATVLDIAKGRFQFMGGNIVSDFSFPSFGDNFSDGKITNDELNTELKNKVALFQKAI